MLKRLIPMLLIVVLVGCSSGVKTEDGRTANTTINESTTGETVKGNTSGVNNTTVTIGDYVVDIPSSWINSDRYYYMNKKGEPPFIQISIINDYELSGILQNKEDFLSGVVSGFENGKLVNDFSETKYNNATGYMYSAEGSLSGYDVILTDTLFENPSGGTVQIGLLDTGTDALSKYQEMLNTLRIEESIDGQEDELTQVPSTASGELAFQDRIVYDDRGIIISTDSIQRDNSSTSFTFIVQNNTDEDYNIEAHAWDINGIMSWKGKNDLNLIKAPSGKKTRMSLEIDAGTLEAYKIDTISEIDVLFWIYDDLIMGWETGLINVRTNQYAEGQRPIIEEKPDYSDDVIDVWFAGKNSLGKYVFFVYNKSPYNASCTIENCSVNDWAYNITDYTFDLYEELVNSGSFVVLSLPIDEKYMRENNITNVESLEFDILLKDDSFIFHEGSPWKYKSNKMTFTQFE